MYHYLHNNNNNQHKTCINTKTPQIDQQKYTKNNSFPKNNNNNLTPRQSSDIYIPKLELSQLSLYSNCNNNSQFTKSQISPISCQSNQNLSNFTYSPRPSTGRAKKSSTSKKTSTKSTTKSKNMGNTQSKPLRAKISPSNLQISTIYTEPYFELTGQFSYGCAERLSPKKSNRDGNNNFTPDAKQLKKEGGKSIKLYENWRIMQYHQNVVMKKFLLNHGVNASVLPHCTSFDMWKDKEWRELYKSATGNGLDQDPCPDCDVRFFKDKEEERKYSFKIAPASLLNSSVGWRKRKFLNSVFVIGLPQHITVACCREFSDHVIFEFFDPAGSSGDNESIKAVREWTKSYLKDKYSTLRHEKPVIFSKVCSTINCQSDKADVMCQTWIWWWVYWRMVRQANVNELTKHLKELIRTKSTLHHISGFKQWLVNLYNMGYLQRECAYERKAAEDNTPPSKEVLERMIDCDLKDFGFTMSMEFCLSCRNKSNESLVKEGICKKHEVGEFRDAIEKCISKLSRESSRISRQVSEISETEINKYHVENHLNVKVRSNTPSKTNLAESRLMLVLERDNF